jgi:hypothetical protein
VTLSKETAFRLAVAVTVPFPPTLPSFGVIPASAIADDMIEKRACPGNQSGPQLTCGVSVLVAGV